ncbi:hypothetical protein TREPR_0037 [Treponema primitia ZAS-2]|uniref:DUF5723 domain-containing protein n=1 Tax=Treponema primitia (strain ATCC BAA-887 / DSM 12427 / ZAS-2) TaxID=545694 RepID=F5YNF1_TREPZ|nr:DUF5723 family protein [Treponema primitia]AEF86960.1 hypothetical protein TREPR_0037 [Treponema primitia ZAS-2]
MKKLTLFFIISSLAWGLYAQEAPLEEVVAESEDTGIVLDDSQSEYSQLEEIAAKAAAEAEASALEAETEFAQDEPVQEKNQSALAKFGGQVLDYFNKPATTRHNEPLRGVEFGYDFTGGFGNSLIGTGDIFKKNIVINLNTWSDQIQDRGVDFGFDFDFHTFINVNIGKGAWGLGEFINSDSRFDINLPKDLFELLSKGNWDNHNQSGNFSVSGATFAEAGLKWYGTFLDKKLRVGVAPAWYLPLVYIPKSSLSYVLQADPSLRVAVSGDMAVYMPFSLDPFELKDLGGADISLSGEYALFPIIDVGTTISHIPFVPATLSNGQTLTFSNDIIPETTNLLSDFPDIGDIDPDTSSFTDANKIVLRPLRVDFYVLYRPLRRDLLTIKPNIGFTAINPSEETYFNGAIELQLNLARIFFVHLNTGIEEGYWRHKLGFALNLHAFELDLEGVLKSQDYLKSYQASGLGVTLGMKVGF